MNIIDQTHQTEYHLDEEVDEEESVTLGFQIEFEDEMLKG
jgi:hypothetical protein